MPLPAPLLGEGLIWHPRARRCQLNTRYAIRLILPSRLQDPTRELQAGYQPLKPRFVAWGRRAQKPALNLPEPSVFWVDPEQQIFSGRPVAPRFQALLERS